LTARVMDAIGRGGAALPRPFEIAGMISRMGRVILGRGVYVWARWPIVAISLIRPNSGRKYRSLLFLNSHSF
jgi:hypothetical protein